MREHPVTIVNKLGLHARAAAKLIDLAKGFESHIELVKGEQSADCKRIMSVLMLEAPIGTELTLRADGNYESEAVDAVLRLFADRFGEGE